MKAEKLKFINYLLLILPLILVLSLWGCGKHKIAELKKEQLFKIPIGNELEELGVKREKNGLFLGPRNLKFINGFFYLVDEVNQKIMKITTLGDVILVLSRGEQEYKLQEDLVKTKQRKRYPFHNIGELAVDTTNAIYVQDKFLEMPQETGEIDIFSANGKSEESSGSEEKYMSYILKFDRLGNFLFKIGKEGVDGNPFYYIYKISTDEKDNLVVLTTDDGWKKWNYYKYDKDGKMLIHKVILSSDLIKIKDPKERAFFIMDALPDLRNGYLVYWISMYETKYDTKKIEEEQHLWGEEIEIDKLEKKINKDKKEKINYKRDLLYYKLVFYDITKNKIVRTYIWENRHGSKIESTNEFIGMDGRGNGFLWRYIGNNTAVITIFKPDGSIVARRSFKFENDGIWDDINVNKDGSVSAIKIGKKYVYFYRWRSDELIDSYGYKKSFIEFLKEKIQEFKNANK